MAINCNIVSTSNEAYKFTITTSDDQTIVISKCDLTFTMPPLPIGLKGDKGDDGDSAYTVAVQQGFVGDEQDWLDSLKGEKGDQGIQGIQGIQGEKGDKGDQGEQGIQGLKGDKGDKGDTGEQGIQGVKGDKGDTGLQGIQGEKGDTGLKGDKGDTGEGVVIGGTTGQILAKKSNTDYDTEWVDKPIDTNDKVKLSSLDPTAGYLDAKLQEGIQAIQFDTTNTPLTNADGLLQWNSIDGTLDLGMNNGTIKQQIGQELFIKVANQTGATIPNGSAVYFDGRLGNTPMIKLARGDSEPTSQVMGLVTEDIISMQQGYITTFGYVRGINTSYPTWAEGQALYLSPSVAGSLTNVKPSATNHSDIVGFIGILGTGSVGSIFVDITRHKKLTELSDVDGFPLTTGGQFPNWSQSRQVFDFDKNINDYGLKTVQDSLLNDRQLMKEPTGFTNNSIIDVSFNSTTKKITLTGSFEAYYKGTKVDELVSGWQSPAIGDVTPSGAYFLYHNGTTIAWSVIPWTFDQIQIAYVYYRADGTYLFTLRETHGYMPWQSHKEFHETIGTYRASGGTLVNYTAQNITPTLRRPDTQATAISDEDLSTVNPTHTSKLYTHAYLLPDGSITSDFSNADIVKRTGNIPLYNLYNGSVWSQAPMDSGQTTRYMSMWQYAKPVGSDSGSVRYQYVWIMGQSAGDLASQETLTPQSLNLGFLSTIAPELVFINQAIIRYRANPTNDWDIYSIKSLTGNKLLQTSASSGLFLSSVSHDATLTGDGTVGNPLSVVQVPPVISGVTVEIDFGNRSGYEKLVVTGQTWVTANGRIIPTLFGEDVGHRSAEDGVIEGIILSVSNIIAGVGFTIHASAPNTTNGIYKIMCIGG